MYGKEVIGVMSAVRSGDKLLFPSKREREGRERLCVVTRGKKGETAGILRDACAVDVGSGEWVADG